MLKLHVVHERAERDRQQLHAVARSNVGGVRSDDRVADAEPDRMQDVALLAVRVVDERDPRGAVRVVLDLRDAAGDVPLVAAEVDPAVLALVAAALVPDGDPAVLPRPPSRSSARRASARAPSG
jgi:hypothetical protein